MSTYKSAFELLTDDAQEIVNYEIRANMMLALRDMIKVKGWTQKEAANFLGVSQPRISDLNQGKISKFSIDMLMGMMVKFGFKFDFTYTPIASTENTANLSDVHIGMNVHSA